MKALSGLCLCLMLAVMGPAFAQSPAPAPQPRVTLGFADPALEARARNLQRQLRCLVCQGESVDESGSPFAADIRALVHRQIAEGKSDQQIQDFLVARYGDFILMRPPFQPDTILLWLAPVLALAAGGLVAWGTIARARARARAAEG